MTLKEKTSKGLFWGGISSLLTQLLNAAFGIYLARSLSPDDVLAWKMPGAGGGGYLALVCRDRDAFPEGAIQLKIRRK